MSATPCSSRPKIREELEGECGQVWDVRELARDFVLTGIIGNVVVVRRRADDVVGRLTFQNAPRFFFLFEPAIGFDD